MAEKYGTVPPRFTKAWWGHFWYYYKWRVLITAAAILIAAVTIVQCVSRPKYDMTITYAGHKVYSDEMSEKMQDVLKEYITDIDGNGKQSIYFQQLTFYDTAGNEEMDSAMQTKLDFTFTKNDVYIYLMDRIEAELYINRDSASRLFESTDVWANDTEAEILTVQDGTGYAVNLKDSRILKENDIYCEDLYLFVRANNKNDEKSQKIYENSLKAAEILIQ